MTSARCGPDAAVCLKGGGKCRYNCIQPTSTCLCVISCLERWPAGPIWSSLIERAKQRAHLNAIKVLGREREGCNPRESSICHRGLCWGEGRWRRLLHHPAAAGEASKGAVALPLFSVCVVEVVVCGDL
jgi:hypothetical protein